jgi:hypothetical protein
MKNKEVYISWTNRMFVKHGDSDIAAYMESVLNPNLGEFLLHQQEQVTRAIEADVYDHHWEYLSRCTMTVTESGSPIAWCRLGGAIQALQGPSSDELIDFLKSEIKTMNREWPLKIRNAELQFLKDIAQRYARKQWQEDVGQKIRIGGMCEIVFSSIYDWASKNNMLAQLPDSAPGIKPWLREVAPKYAQNKGRPKKSNK